MENKEIYKIIPDYENYSVSNLGNIMNTKTGKAIESSIRSMLPLINNNDTNASANHKPLEIINKKSNKSKAQKY